MRNMLDLIIINYSQILIADMRKKVILWILALPKNQKMCIQILMEIWEIEEITGLLLLKVKIIVQMIWNCLKYRVIKRIMNNSRS